MKKLRALVWKVNKSIDSVYLKDWSPIDIDGVVVHHLHYGYTEVAANAKRDAEAQAAENGDDVALGQTPAAQVQQRGTARWSCHWTPILRQFNLVLLVNVGPIYFPAEKIQKRKQQEEGVKAWSRSHWDYCGNDVATSFSHYLIKQNQRQAKMWNFKSCYIILSTDAQCPIWMNSVKADFTLPVI